MKTFFRILIFVVAGYLQSKAQCNLAFTATTFSTGQVQVVATVTPNFPTTTFTWTFGAPYISPVVATFAAGGATANITYTASGNYVIIVTTSSPACTYSQNVTVNITPSCAILATISPAYFSSCTGGATLNAPGMCSPVSYTWSNLATGSSQNSLCPGNYTITTSAAGASCCVSSSTVISIPNNTVCNLAANFSTAVSGNTVTFSSVSTGTFSGTNYFWSFGDGGIGSGTSSIHTYTAPGTYSAYLIATNNSVTCRDSSSTQLVTPIFCNLNASFSVNPITSDSIQFVSTSTGTAAGATFFWQFGDGGTSTLSTAFHKYNTPGPRIVTLTVNNNFNPPCVSTFTFFIYAGCPLVASFSHTMGLNGNVTFSNTSTGTWSTATSSWNFGDGYASLFTNPFHTYGNAGTHYVRLIVNNNFQAGCIDTVIQAINVTGITCQANSGFSIVPSGTPQLLYAIPNYPYNVTGAKWKWGDGDSSLTLYASHIYPNSGTYNVCLSVTVSCAQSSTTCINQVTGNSSASRTAGTLTINVVTPAIKLGVANTEDHSASVIYPVPSSGELFINNETNATLIYTLHDLNGRVISTFEKSSAGLMNVRLDVPDGIYLLNENSGTYRHSYRIVIMRQ